MKKSFFAAALFITAFGFTSCEDETNGGSLKIEAKVVNGNDYNNLIDEVRVVTSHDWSEEIQPTEVITCNYNNGGFSVTLPKKIIENAYTFINDKGQTVMSNDIHAQFFAYKNKERIGEFVYRSSDSAHIVIFFYSFRNGKVCINLLTPVTQTFKLKKGWNAIYFSKDDYYYYAYIEKPKTDLNWYFIPN